eukprot:1272037-Prymnesium_polylepis.2
MVGDAVDFEEMKVKLKPVESLKDELMARGASRTEVERVLQQRLHTLIVQAAAEKARARADSDL